MIAALAWIALAVTPQETPQVSTPAVLRVGHVVEVRGELDAEGRFVAQKIELQRHTSDDVLLGTVAAGETDPARFTLLGQPVETDGETQWEELERGSLAEKRVRVKGSWKGPRRFRAESIAARAPGRDRIGARIDELREVEGGWEARLMIFTVLVPEGTEVEHEKPLGEYELAPARKTGRADDDDDRIERDEDDSFGKGIELTPELRLLGQLELTSEYEEDFDLNDRSDPDDRFDEDRLDSEAVARLRLAWAPREDLVGVAELRYSYLYRLDEDDGENDTEIDHDARLGETWFQWRDAAGREGFDVTAGRQDFDDPREWLYDQNLDALRLSWIRRDLRLDVSAATVLSDGSNRDEESTNAIAYLSNNDEDAHLAAWVLYRDTDEVAQEVNADDGTDVVVDLAETSLHMGLRAIGEWLPQNDSWAELAFLVGERDGPVDQGASNVVVEEFDVSTWAYDVGTTWKPPFAKPLYFTIGYALGRGDSNVAESYRQTGYQDNTARFGGVTSFSYYGELFEPELSNVGISTLGVGARIAERTSLDLVFHTYEQDMATDEFSPRPGIEANLDERPNGLDADLGWELDAIFGYRRIRNLDVEIVAAMFEPGDAFDEEDTAYFAKFQLRYRF